MASSLVRRSLPLAVAAFALGIGSALVVQGPVALADHHAAESAAPEGAIAVLRPTKGDQKVRGTIRFMPGKDGTMKVKGKINNLPPNSTHGFHIHEYGDISANDGTATGGHFNPEGHDHALPDESGPKHAGDMGNVTSDAEGTAEVDITVEGISLEAGPDCILGRGLIVHAKADDGGQPTGNAGDRIAQAVIGIMMPKEKKEK